MHQSDTTDCTSGILAPVAAIDYRPRLADQWLRATLAEFPAVMVTGARAVGKTTTAVRLAKQVAQMDEPRQAAVWRADPDAALASMRLPALLDEWQEVPEALGAVKRSVDSDPTPGRYLLTGSVHARIEQRIWPGTGRLITAHMGPVSRRELDGSLRSVGSWIRSLTDGVAPELNGPDLNLLDYANLIVAGGFPEVVYRDRSPASAATWYRSYLDQLVARDTGPGSRDPERLRSWLIAAAACTAQTPQDTTLNTAAGVNRATGSGFETLLTDLGVIERIPAWSTNRLTALTSQSKLIISDPGLACAALGVTVADLMTDGVLLGQMLETFVASQIGPELTFGADDFRMRHLRTQGGRQEVDFVLAKGRAVVGLEVKASAAPTTADARHLRWLAQRLGANFRCGAVLHTGSGTYQLDKRILALPIRAIWQS